MKKLKIGLMIAISVGIALLILQNTARVQAHFLWFTAEIPIIVLLFFSAVGGFVLGLIVAFFSKGNVKSKKI